MEDVGGATDIRTQGRQIREPSGVSIEDDTQTEVEERRVVSVPDP